MTNIKAGIIGGAGFTGGETLRILLHHPQVEIKFVHSRSNAGNKLYAVHADLLGETELTFTEHLHYEEVDVVILCLGHGESRVFLQNNPVPEPVKIIDLSHDFRLAENAGNFVYGLPELQRKRIKEAKAIANPGCFATCIQLGLLPLAKAGQLQEEIHISAITGSTGAGQKLQKTTGFTWRNNNISTYKAFTHQHLHEIKQSLASLQGEFQQEINFIPYRGNFTRGILASIYLNCPLSEEEVVHLYQEYYQEHPFTHVSSQPVDLKQVVNTNKCFIHVQKQGNKVLITSAIDNLAKGASGQAIQNMNLLFGLEETAGLLWKPAAF
ncbi:N-acetyl-gamma-glutamyl-phosphate reductase [Rapidithrix thailandica]|uniref:N-acetyl-gamma-glutamyl-phosphate reductase n=1 Tax=Rapidithrix thailandica TaxID=413964 RepID=A0AAW9S7R3_9BACT